MIAFVLALTLALQPPAPAPLPSANAEQLRTLAQTRAAELRATIASQQAALAELLKANAAAMAELAQMNKVVESLGGKPAPVPEALGVGKPGKDGHSPILTWVGDQIAIDGKVTGPHLTGPAGPPGPPGGPPPVVDPFAKEVADAFADATTNKAALPALITVWSSLLPYVDTDPDTGQLYTRYKAGFEAAKLAGKLPLVMDAINRPLYTMLGSTAQPLTPTLRAQLTSQINRTLDVLKGLVK